MKSDLRLFINDVTFVRGNELLCEISRQTSIHQSVTKRRERVKKCVTSFMYELKSVVTHLTIQNEVFSEDINRSFTEWFLEPVLNTIKKLVFHKTSLVIDSFLVR